VSGNALAGAAVTEPGRPRLDEEKLEMLRKWGEGLRRASGDEFAAAGRAILMLIEEIEQLHVDLWHARQHVSDTLVPTGVADETIAHGEPGLATTLRARLRRRRKPDGDGVPDLGSAVEGEEVPGSETAPSAGYTEASS
jgi:hypothetical protein